jgi:cytochrome b561
VRLRNDASGYGVVTKTLHWVTVAALVAQLVVGYLLDDDDGGGQGRGRGRGRGEESGRGRGRGGDDGADGGGDDVEGLLGALSGDDVLLRVHVVLGVTILVVTLLRIVWRRTTPLPPWADGLSAGERRLAHATETTLYVCLLVMPATGLTLLLVDDDLLPLHVASHVAFFVALLLHVGLVLKHQLVDRDRLLNRML